MGEYVNSNQTRFDKSFVSCGLVEVHHLPKQSSQQTLFSLANYLYNKGNPRPAAFAIFSDIIPENNESKSRGQLLANFIKEKTPDVGSLWESKKEVNPKTGNIIQIWILHINHEQFRNWYKEELANRITES